MVVQQLMVWLCAFFLAGMQAIGVPRADCVSGHRWAVCWRLPANGYSVALVVAERSWSAYGCLPGLQRQADPYSPSVWSCGGNAP
jgi:hypothetical protein